MRQKLIQFRSGLLISWTLLANNTLVTVIPTVLQKRLELLLILNGQACHVHLDLLLQTVLVVLQMHSVTNTVLVNVWSTTQELIVVNTVDHVTMLVLNVQVQELSTVRPSLCAWSMLHTALLNQLAVNVTLIILPHTAQYTAANAILDALSAMDHPPTSVKNALTMLAT